MLSQETDLPTQSLDAPISLDTPAPQPDQIDLDAPGMPQIPDDKVAGQRAVKAHIAFGADSPGPDQLLSEIKSGNEEQMRKRLAIAKDIALRQTKMDVITNVAAEKARKGEQMTEDDAKFIAGLSQEQINHDPSTILETEYARQYFNHQAQLNGGKNVIADNVQKDPEATSVEMDVASNIKTRQEIVKSGIENLQREHENSSWGSYLANEAARFIPLLENYRLHDSKGDSILPGANLQERVQRLWTMPPAQFKAQFEQDLSELKALNPLTAMKYAQSVLSFSSSDELLDNAFGLIDASTLPVVGTTKLLAKGVRAGVTALGERRLATANKSIVSSRNEVKQALKDGVKADSTVEVKPLEQILERAGDVEQSAQVGAYSDALKAFSGQDPLSESSRLKASVPSMFNIDRILEGTQNLAREATDRLRNSLMGNAADLLNAVSKTSRVSRLEEGSDALRVATQNAWDRLKSAYPHLSDAVLDMSRVPAEKTAPNAHEAVMELGKNQRTASEIAVPSSGQVETSLGKPDATLFKDRREADYWAHEVYKLDPKAYSVLSKQQGVGFYIGVRAPINETEDGVRDVLISTRHQTPVGLFNTFLGRLRTPEDTLSIANRENRHVATHGAQELHRLAKGTADAIGQIPNKSIKKLDALLTANRDEIYQEGDQIRRGIFYQNVGEFDTAWTARFGKSPTEKERLAYFSAVQLNDWDWVFRNLGLYRDKSRQGIEKYSFAHLVADETSGEKALVKTRPIEGRQVKDIPWEDTENAGLWVYDGQTNSGKFFDKNLIDGADKADIINKINTQGYKVVQIANPIERELRKIADNEDVVHFIVVPDVDRTPLDWKQLPYRPGGHVEYQFEHWVKQPKIRRTQDGRQVYEGDQSIFNQATEAEAKKFADSMDTARVLLRDNKLDELAAYLPGHLPYDFDSFRGLFTQVTLKDGTKVEPRLSLSDPIRHTISGRNLLDAHPDIERGYDKFENQIRSSYNLYSQIDKKYASQREETLGTVRERMGSDRALFELEPSKLIDPLTTMNRAMANIMRGRYLNDYKIQSVETFIQEFGDLLKVEGGLAEIRKNPVYYLHNAPWDTQTPDKARLAAGRNSQRAVLNLLGSSSELGQNLRWMQESLLNSIYNKAGQKTSDYIAEHLLPTTQDPFRYARGVAFHSKLGLFNPVQLFLQAQTLTHVTAVSGLDNGLRGLSAASLMWRLALTEDKKIIEHFGNMASKLGWKKEDFLESYAALKKTGLFNVEGEVALRDDVFDPKIFKGAWGTFLDKGTFFFREGERITRLTAWNAAYREWKVANPGKVLDNAALSSILLRQNTLSVNMTRASSSWWQQGFLSVPTQFFAYQARLMEQFLGKRLTTAEKARAFMTYSAMYGVPTAMGAVTFAYPWYDDVRQAALERGYDVNSPGLRALIEGIPSTMIQMITGNEQNYAQRLGPVGVQYFKDVFLGKISQVFGASPKIAMDMASAIAPVFKAVVSLFIPGMGDWKLTSADAITALEQISTINNVGKAIYALNTHKFISKNEIDLGPATTADALLTAMIGTQPLRVTDAFIMGEMATEQKKMQDAVKKEVIKNYRRALREFQDGNDTAAEKLMSNAHLQLQGGGFHPDQMNQILEQAITGYESLLDKMNRQYIENAPMSQYWDRIYRVFRVRPNKPNEEKK